VEEQLPEVVAQMRSLNQDGLLFIYDRGYSSLKFIQQHHKLKVDFIFRLQKRNYSKLWKRILSGELDFVLENKTTSQKVRVTVLTLANGETEVLITSLFNREKFTLEDISKACVLRWHIQDCYKRLKIGSELENFSAINLEAILQEFWANLVMCNILSLHMCDVQGP
jgi:hypothetical protein